MAGTVSTIIAVFKDGSNANAAATDLSAAGVAREDIHLESQKPGTGASRAHTSAEGGITGWFKSVFSQEDDADRSGYENALSQGNFLLRVDVDEDDIPTVEDILNRHSPVDIHADTGSRRAGEATQAIPVVEEELQVGKRQVLRGGVRVYSRVVEEPVEEEVQLREERVRVERRPVNRSASDADLRAGQEQVIEVQEFAEEPVVAKQARVVEEIRVGKDVSERTQTVRDTLRHTEVDVQQAPESSGASLDDPDFRSDFQQRYGTGSETYESYQPAYRYGYDMASRPQYRGKSFDEIESDLRTDYGKRYPNSTWEKMKDAVRYGWNKVTGKAKSAAH